VSETQGRGVTGKVRRGSLGSAQEMRVLFGFGVSWFALDAQGRHGARRVSHRGDAQVLASPAASVVLLVSFVLIEMRSSCPLLPMRVLATATGQAPT
jgi:hypothetical protein